MNIEEAVAGIGTAQDEPGLPMAWRWSPMSRLVFSLAMDHDGQWAYQMNSLDVHDDGLTRAVLAFARQHQLGRGRDARPLTVLPGFAYGAYRFDAVAAASPAVHGYHHGRNEALNEVVSAGYCSRRPLITAAARSGHQSRRRPATTLASNSVTAPSCELQLRVLLPGSSSLPDPAVLLGYVRNHNHANTQCLLRPT